ncbi:MAG: hypothetical protein C0524_08280 [Rhodobacter sp.]|nr:hypothetical protein [Rhodobacter sp.]
MIASPEPGNGAAGLFSMPVSEFPGAEPAPVIFETEGRKRRLLADRIIQGEGEPIAGPDPEKEVTVTNTGSWMGPDITIATANEAKVRALGRVWDLDGRSAEICQIDWRGPG